MSSAASRVWPEAKSSALYCASSFTTMMLDALFHLKHTFLAFNWSVIYLRAFLFSKISCDKSKKTMTLDPE